MAFSRSAVFIFLTILCPLFHQVQGRPGPSVVTNCTQQALETAIAGGSYVTFGCEGIIQLTNTIVLSKTITLDATGRSVTISGQGSVRLFDINSAQATFKSLTLANGRHLGTNGVPTPDRSKPAGHGFGGAIYASNSTVRLMQCVLTNNTAVGGPGRDEEELTEGEYQAGSAFGGSIFGDRSTLELHETSILSSTVVPGRASGPAMFPYADGDFAHGGAVYLTNSQAKISSSHFVANAAHGPGGYRSGNGKAGRGGAIFAGGTPLEIFNSTFVSNHVSGGGVRLGLVGPAQGGAIYADGTLALTNSTFQFNSALAGGTGSKTAGKAEGGAIFSLQNLSATACAFDRNKVEVSPMADTGLQIGAGGDGYGGAIFSRASAVLNQCSITANTAIGGEGLPYGTSFGGAISAYAELTVENSTVALNAAGNGPGIFLSGPDALVRYSTIASNYFHRADSTTQQGTYPGTQLAGTNSAAIRLKGTILAAQEHPSLPPGITDLGFNIAPDNVLSHPNSLNNTDPALSPPQHYNGVFALFPLQSPSPALDAADPTDYPAFDQRGVPRPFQTLPDIGAYEFRTETVQITLELVPNQQSAALSLVSRDPLARPFIIEESQNLSTWNPIKTNSAGSNELRLEISTEGPLRFFRAHITE